LKPQKSFPGRRAFWFARISLVMHFFEPIGFGLGLAAGIFLTTRQTGAIVLLDRRGGTSNEVALAGVLLLAGVTLIAASLLFFHRKARVLRQRFLAGGSALLFFLAGYSLERGSIRVGSFFGFSTLTPSTSFVEDFPARPKVRYEVNGWGMRGGEWSQQKAGGVVRVAIVGDSFVFGSGVEEADTLSQQLGERLRERFASSRFEVLNLGVPGNNLASHLGMLRVAEEKLDADVLVLCLTLPNDLSEWDGQEERLAHGRIGGFSLASFLFGYRAAITLWGERKLARDLTREGLAFLQAEVSRFGEARGAGPAKPTVVFAYSFEDPRVTEQLRRIPNAVIVPSVRWADEYFIAGDGHPNALGNKVFSRLIASTFAPAWVTRK
jgi:hypothetical protein